MPRINHPKSEIPPSPLIVSSNDSCAIVAEVTVAEQMKLRDRKNVSLDRYVSVLRGTPDEHLEWLLLRSIEQKKKELKKKTEK